MGSFLRSELLKLSDKKLLKWNPSIIDESVFVRAGQKLKMHGKILRQSIESQLEAKHAENSIARG